MPDTRLMPVGIDLGANGGMVAVDGNTVFHFGKIPSCAVKIRPFEADKKRIKMLASKSKVALAQKRFKLGDRAGELKPKITRSFNAAQLMFDTVQLAARAEVAGYSGLFFLLEAPMTATGRVASRATSHFESVAGYFSTGRCQNAWYSVFATTGFGFAEVKPQTWRAGLKLKGDKTNSVAMAKHLYPDAPEELLASHDLAESLLLCHYLKTQGSRYLQ